MKLLLTILLICFLPFNANATPIPNEKGQQYYMNCMKQPDPRLLPGSQDVFCKCTGNMMLKNMTMEDLVGMSKNERPTLNKMMIGVYAPCMEIPVHDVTYTEFANQKIPPAMSECIARGIGKYTATEASRLLGSVLDKYPNAFDPVAAIKQTPEFEAQQKNIAAQCAQTVR